jgi:hypothetical protein
MGHARNLHKRNHNLNYARWLTATIMRRYRRARCSGVSPRDAGFVVASAGSRREQVGRANGGRKLARPSWRLWKPRALDHEDARGTLLTIVKATSSQVRDRRTKWLVRGEEAGQTPGKSRPDGLP